MVPTAPFPAFAYVVSLRGGASAPLAPPLVAPMDAAAFDYGNRAGALDTSNKQLPYYNLGSLHRSVKQW